MKKENANKYKEIKDRLQDKHSDRAKTSLYLSKSLLERFKKSCGSATPSRVLEELMADFIENTK
jgi:hypothetical protein